MEVFRCAENPIIEPRDVRPAGKAFEVVGVFNAGAARLGDEVILLLRVAERPVSSESDIVQAATYDVEQDKIILKDFKKGDPENDFSDPRLIVTPAGTYLTSLSHLRLARSTDGINFKIDKEPTLMPANEYEAFGLEDSRITLIDGVYYIAYVAVSALGVTTCLISTEDFKYYKRHGVIFCPDNKDVVIFGGRCNNKYYALHRPVSGLFKKNEMWIAESPDLCCWGEHRYLMSPRPGLWDSIKLGASAVPFKTERGWLEVYHGVDDSGRYSLGAVLLDGEVPSKIIARSQKPILEPQTCYECNGFFGKVVFSCGLLCEDGLLKIYYGAADSTICYAHVSLQDVLESLGP